MIGRRPPEAIDQLFRWGDATGQVHDTNRWSPQLLDVNLLLVDGERAAQEAIVAVAILHDVVKQLRGQG